MLEIWMEMLGMLACLGPPALGQLNKRGNRSNRSYCKFRVRCADRAEKRHQEGGVLDVIQGAADLVE